VISAYILFAYMWYVTVFHGIWNQESAGEDDDIELEETRAVRASVSTLVYSFFFTMMLVSHFMTMCTSPGQMPKLYKQLVQEDLPKDFFDLIHLRESIYSELIVSKKMRKGELSRD